MGSIRLYNINVERHKIIFDGIGVGSSLVIGKINIVSCLHIIDMGWCELLICDQSILKCPFAWLSRENLNVSLSEYENFSLRVFMFDETDSWFHGSDIKLIMLDLDGENIDIECRGRYDCYTKKEEDN
jgi:hypothetical protein